MSIKQLIYKNEMTFNWAERNVLWYTEPKTHEIKNSFKLKIECVMPILCDFVDAYILMTSNIGVTSRGEGLQVVFKNCALFTNYITNMSNARTDKTKSICIAMSMYNSDE